MTEQFRTEKDSMGEFQVPLDANYGASTARAVENFPISNLRFTRVFIRALGEIKRACAVVNQKNNLLEKNIAKAIIESSKEVIDGKHDNDFVVDIFQTGSGTSTNMNANEIIAKLATEKSGIEVHPNDHVNMSQSSNDVIPSATNVAVVIASSEGLIPELTKLWKLIESKVYDNEDYTKGIKNGRTHLMDATPVTFFDVFAGYADLIHERSLDIESQLINVRKLAIGGTAVGNGLNAPKFFGEEVAKELKKSLGTHFERPAEPFTRQGSRDEIVQFSGTLKSTASTLFKIANDIRWMASGPISGLNEIKIPALQPGSSIMPGKVNPVIPEMMMQVSAQIIGNDATVSIAGMNGNFELNTMLPVMAHNILESIEILTNGATIFGEKLIEGIEPNLEISSKNVEKNPILVTALVPVLGYDKAAEVAKEAMSQNKTIKEVLIEKNLISSEEIDELLNIEKLI